MRFVDTGTWRCSILRLNVTWIGGRVMGADQAR